MRIDKEEQTQERYEKMVWAEYNRLYKEIRTIGKLSYILAGYKGRDQSKRVRFRCENEALGNRYWRNKEENKCRLCNLKVETLEHLLKECTELSREIYL